MSGLLLTTTLLSALNIGGDVRSGNGDYEITEFAVPEGTVEIVIRTDYTQGDDILDWGVWAPEGMRGWSGGLLAPIVVGVADSSPGYQPGPITPGTWQLVIGKASIESEVVAWTGTIEFHDAATLVPRERAEVTPVVLESNQRWYAGDFHVHTDESGDAPAKLSEAHDLAVEHGLDFIVISDHNTTSGHELQAAAQAGFDDLLLIRGNEVTTYGGHGNALGASTMIDHRVGYEDRTADGIIEDVVDADGIFAINHPNLGILGNCIGCGWDHDVDWSKVSALEVHNGNYDIGIAVFTPQVIEMWEEKHSQGHRLAAIGGSDDHRAGIDLEPHQSPIGFPTTWVLADRLSEADILRGVREGRTWIQLAGPSSPHIELTVAGNGGEEGTIGDTVRGSSIQVDLIVGNADGMHAVLYRDGRLVESVPIEGVADVALQLRAEVPEAGARFHVEITDGQPRTLTSHFYATYEEAPKEESGGCRVTQSSRAGGLGFVLIMLLVAHRRRR